MVTHATNNTIPPNNIYFLTCDLDCLYAINKNIRQRKIAILDPEMTEKNTPLTVAKRGEATKRSGVNRIVA